MSHTYTLLTVSSAAYDEIRSRLLAAGSGEAIADGLIDMHGLAIAPEPEADEL